MSLKEYLDQEEEVLEEVIIPFEYSDLTKKVFKQAYLNFYYFVVNNKDQVEWFVKMVDENCYLTI